MKKQYLVSISGGKTSATLSFLLIQKYNLTPIIVYKPNTGKIWYIKLVNKASEYIFVFANTSREREETLVFLKNIEHTFKIPIVWLEAFVFYNERKGTTFKITSFEKAKRNGSVFEGVIKKYGIPNTMYIHCTRELKANPINSFAKSIGWKDYTTIIGYRADEPKRVNLIKAKKEKQWYPLYEWNYKKEDVDIFWSKQSFKLDLLEYEGNCKLCYKKSKRKLLTQIITDPSSTEWVKEMEDNYRYFQKDGRNNFPKEGVVFFRNNESIYDLIEEAKSEFEVWKEPIKSTQLGFDFDLDEQEDCAESCEPF